LGNTRTVRRQVVAGCLGRSRRLTPPACTSGRRKPMATRRWDRDSRHGARLPHDGNGGGGSAPIRRRIAREAPSFRLSFPPSTRLKTSRSS
jgi:hypothetical protein